MSPIEPIDKSIYCSSVCKSEINEIELSGGDAKSGGQMCTRHKPESCGGPEERVTGDTVIGG